MLHELVPNVYWSAPEHSTDRPALGAIAGSRDTLMVDAGNSARHAGQFLDALARTGAPPLRHLVLTHAHWDHVFGASAVDARCVATAATCAEVATMATYAWDDDALDERVAAGLEIAFCRDMIKAELDPRERTTLEVRVPDVGFDGELVIDLGERIVRVIHVGGDHAADSCIIVVPGAVAFLGDCIYQNLHVEPNRLTRRVLFPLLDSLLALDVPHYVLAHDDEPMSRSAFEAHARELRVTGEAVERHETNDEAINETLSSAAVPVDPDVVRAFQAGLAHEDG